MRSKIIYITYDGIMEPLGQSQVLQYLLVLAKEHFIVLISYEKSIDWQDKLKREKIRRELEGAGIRWMPLRYHKKPTILATSYDLFIGFMACLYFILIYSIKIIHARSYVPSVIALIFKKIFKTRFVFDMRGFWVDERVDAGLWKRESLIYNIGKWFEKRFFINSDIVVSLTHAGIAAARELPYLKNTKINFEVIPTCTNLELFRPFKHRRGTNLTIGYVGTVGSWYLFDPVLECFKILSGIKPEARLLIINHNEHSFIYECLQKHAISEKYVKVKAVEHSEVPSEMAEMDAGIFFIKPVFSKRASAPTKLGEFLACGIPCMGNAGIGDMEQILEIENVGVVIREFNKDAYRTGIYRLLNLMEDPVIKIRCRETAENYFSLDKSVRSYSKIYDSLEDKYG